MCLLVLCGLVLTVLFGVMTGRVLACVEVPSVYGGYVSRIGVSYVGL